MLTSDTMIKGSYSKNGDFWLVALVMMIVDSTSVVYWRGKKWEKSINPWKIKIISRKLNLLFIKLIHCYLDTVCDINGKFVLFLLHKGNILISFRIY